MTKRLTRDDLIKMNLRIMFDENYNPIIERYGKYRRNSTPKWFNLKISKAKAKHKYGKLKVYPTISFSYKDKRYCYTVSKVVYAWVYGEVPANMDVDHVDNNPFNNKITNLRLLSRKENLDIRLMSQSQIMKAYYYAKSHYTEEELEQMYKEQEENLKNVSKM